MNRINKINKKHPKFTHDSDNVGMNRDMNPGKYCTGSHLLNKLIEMCDIESGSINYRDYLVGYWSEMVNAKSE
jgi:hypothetical protein